VIAPSRQLLAGLLPNLRDCGGLGTADGKVLRDRLLLRSAALVGLGPATLAAFIAAVGTGSYVDLRTDKEIARDGAPRELIEAGWTWHRLPVSDGNTGDNVNLPVAPIADVLRRSLRAMPAYLDAARQVSQMLGPRPVTVGCAVGKDRTGLVVAIVLQWLGIARAEILDDYALSNTCLRSGRRLLPPRWHHKDHAIGLVDTSVCAAVLDQAAVTALPAAQAGANDLFVRSLTASQRAGRVSEHARAAAARRA